MTLHVGDVDLPDEYATTRGAILAISGAGKSNTAVVLAEEFTKRGIPWFALDPKGDWWGMRSDASGNGPGLAVPVFGGEHGDVALDPKAGALMARLIAKRRLTCILDLSGEEFAVRADMFRFLEDFANTLLRQNTTAVHGFLEECDDYLPQNPREGGPAARALGAMQRLVKRGRQKGIGVTMVSQRAAAVNKDALNMAETLIAMRVQASRDVTAVREWVVGPSGSEVSDDDAALLASLSTLENGEAWVVSPQALKVRERVQFRRRETFDSGATPELGEVLAAPSTLADVDIDALGKEMAALVDQARADDPDLLRADLAAARTAEMAARAEVEGLQAQIETLRKDVDTARAAFLARSEELDTERAKPAPAPVTVPVEVAVVPAELVDAVRLNAEELATAAGSLQRRIADVVLEFADEIVATGDKAAGVMRAYADQPPQVSEVVEAADVPAIPPARSTGLAPPSPPPAPPPNDDGFALKAGARRLLDAVVALPGCTVAQAATTARLGRTGGTFGTYLGHLITAGYITVEGSRKTGRLHPTATGRTRSGTTPIPTDPAAVLNHWRTTFKAGARRMLDVLERVGGVGVTRDELATRADIEQSGGTFGTYLGHLRTAGLLEERDGRIMLAEYLRAVA